MSVPPKYPLLPNLPYHPDSGNRYPPHMLHRFWSQSLYHRTVAVVDKCFLRRSHRFLYRDISLFPLISKINNNGFDGEGTNCKRYNRFKFDFDKSESKSFKFPSQIIMNPQLRRMALSYHSIPKRIWSKIMYMIYK